MKTSFENHFEEYQRDGFTVFRNYLSKHKVESIRARVTPEFSKRFEVDPNLTRTTISDLLDNAALSHLMTKHLLNPVGLDFTEHVMGPFVQLDSIEITGFPSRSPKQYDQVANWHRDAFSYSDQWSNHPSSEMIQSNIYTAPTACNCLTYLQDMNMETGSLRVIPGSHLDFTHIQGDATNKSHSREKLIELQSGDMVFTHNELLHSGSTNTSPQIRFFISIYFQRIGLPHRDRFDVPNIDVLCRDAHIRNDRRILRLFGLDALFSKRERKTWSSLINEDRKLLSENLKTT